LSYHFMTVDEFRAGIARGGFLEHAEYCGNYYGTPKDKVLEQLENGRDVIIEIERAGARQVRAHYPEGVYIFVCPPSMEELKKRLVGRGTESEEKVAARLHKAEQEFKRAGKYNYMLLNDDIDSAVRRLEAIVEAEKCFMPKNIEFIENFTK
ncbi:MAG: guanylate kinase, partial [Oscillospiraceae bacterium]|nr:guanylate kinase [Oscillospiraceae bacterium]